MHPLDQAFPINSSTARRKVCRLTPKRAASSGSAGIQSLSSSDRSISRRSASAI